jgi:hypothetical protein
MRRSEFVSDYHVNGFIQWIAPRMDAPGSLRHSYLLKKRRELWECDSIYSAFENYSWDFSFFSLIANEQANGNTFQDTQTITNMISQHLKDGLKDNDSTTCKNCCLDILKWGGVKRHNDIKISDLGDSLSNYLADVNTKLRSDRSSDEYYSEDIFINSGFTKIYSLFVDDFIMYDGRVGAALGLLVRMYCAENNLACIPDSLRFAWGRGKESQYANSECNRRNPSSEKYVFPELLNNPQRHLECNIRANWLLKEITLRTTSKFNNLRTEDQTTALQSALFMIGYCVRTQ